MEVSEKLQEAFDYVALKTQLYVSPLRDITHMET